MIEKVLIVSQSEKSALNIELLVKRATFSSLTLISTSGAKARRMVLDEAYSLVVINSPLLDDNARDLAMMIVKETEAGVIILVKEEFYDETVKKMGGYGVIVVTKPVIFPIFSQSISLINSINEKISYLKKENLKLQKKVDEVKLISKAKCLLIEKKGCTEEEAHHLLERRAMNARISAKEAAGQILRLYSD